MTAAERKRTPSRLLEFVDRGLLCELGIPALVASLVLFVCAMTLLGANVAEMRAGNMRVQRSNTALLQLAMINADILRIEMIVRGYALSGDPIYPVWQKMAEDSMQTRFVSLDKVLADDQKHRANVAKLKSLVRSHASYFDRLSAMVPTNRDAVVAEVVVSGKKVRRRSIEDLLVAMRNDQMQYLAEQQREAEVRVVDAYRYAIGISVVALLLGAIGFAILIHDRRTDRRSFAKTAPAGFR